MKINFFVTLDHKTSNKGHFSEIEIYKLSESWINKLSIDVWFVRIGQYLVLSYYLRQEIYKISTWNMIFI